MKLSFYMDVHIPRSITNALRLKSINILTAQEDNTTLLDDKSLLQRATEKERVLVSFDTDLLSIVTDFYKTGKNFSGLIYAHPLKISIGKCIKDIETIASVVSVDEMQNQIIFLPI